VRDRARTIIVYVAAILFAGALVHRFYRLGGPYFQMPQTVQDHVWPEPFPSRDVILLARRAAEILPRGSIVTAVNPPEAPNYDQTLFLTAGGMMPHHRVVPPALTATDPAALPQYVLAVRAPFNHPRYRLLRSLPEGRIYEVIR
jgi:hypothetical protein